MTRDHISVILFVIFLVTGFLVSQITLPTSETLLLSNLIIAYDLLLSSLLFYVFRDKIRSEKKLVRIGTPVFIFVLVISVIWKTVKMLSLFRYEPSFTISFYYIVVLQSTLFVVCCLSAVIAEWSNHNSTTQFSTNVSTVTIFVKPRIGDTLIWLFIALGVVCSRTSLPDDEKLVLLHSWGIFAIWLTVFSLSGGQGERIKRVLAIASYILLVSSVWLLIQVCNLLSTFHQEKPFTLAFIFLMIIQSVLFMVLFMADGSRGGRGNGVA